VSLLLSFEQCVALIRATHNGTRFSAISAPFIVNTITIASRRKWPFPINGITGFVGVIFLVDIMSCPKRTSQNEGRGIAVNYPDQ
jgi:hypothetical protein